MTVNRCSLKNMAQSTRVLITKGQEQAILQRFGTEPEPYEWSQQDIAVQIRNYLHCGEWEKPME